MLVFWIFGIAIEQNPVADERAAQSFPNVISMQCVEDLKGDRLSEVLRRHAMEGVVSVLFADFPVCAKAMA